MKKTVAIILLCATLMGVISLASCQARKPQKYTDHFFGSFDTVTTVIGYADSKDDFDVIFSYIKALLLRYHMLYDIYNEYEGVNNLATVNKVVDGAHQTVSVDKEIIELLKYAKEAYTLTGGATNVAMGSVTSLWHNCRLIASTLPLLADVPNQERLSEASKHTNIENVVIDEAAGTVFLSDPEMTLDVGSLAKGYAVEMVARDLEKRGFSGYLINAGGNIRAIGGGEGGKHWSVGIENPNTADEENDYVEYLKIKGEAVVTSGVYQRFYVYEDKKYHHIIDPETLYPAEHGYLSVSIICEDSALSDAISTALMTMTLEEGKALVASTYALEAMWVLENGEKIYSDGFEAYTFEYQE